MRNMPFKITFMKFIAFDNNTVMLNIVAYVFMHLIWREI